MARSSDPSSIKMFDFRGGINTTKAPFLLDDNEVTLATDVDFREGTLGCARGGAAQVSLTGSIFERALPTIGASISGGFNAAVSGSVTIAADSAAGGVATNVMLVFYVATTGTISGTPTFQGSSSGVVLMSTVTQGTYTLASYRIATPSLTGGAIAVTLTGAADCRIAAWYVNNVDNGASPAFLSTGGSGAAVNTAELSSNSFNAQYLAFLGIGHNNSAATFGGATGTVQSGLTAGGGLELDWGLQIGMAPTTMHRRSWGGAASAWAGNIFGLRGVANATLANGNENLRVVMRHTPTNDISGDELWVQDDWGRLDRRVAGTWQTGVPYQNALVGSTTTPSDVLSYATNGASLHGKFFIAMDGGLYVNRLHVWDGSVLRWAGLDINNTTSLPTVADTAVAGAYNGVRYFRARMIQKNGAGAVVRRSEPLAAAPFTPNGAFNGAVITRFGLFSFCRDEGATHWEVEASTDNLLFYRIAEVAIGTTTYTDTTAFNTGYSAVALPVAGTVAPAIGEYIPPTAPRHVVVDGDRLLMGGLPTSAVNFSVDISDDSRISWTPLRADTGVGNDERVPVTARFFQDLDGVSGGRVNQLMPAMLGGVFVFKQGRIYKMNRSGNTPAYTYITYHPTRGCVLRGAVDGVDADGNPAIYFTDPNVGFCSMNNSGVTDIAAKIRSAMTFINLNANVVARALYYPKHWLLWVSVSTQGATMPSELYCYNVRYGSWTQYTGTAIQIVNACLFPNSTGEMRPIFVPVTNSGAANLLEGDSGVLDNGQTYTPRILTKEYIPSGFGRRFGIQNAVLTGRTNTGGGASPPDPSYTVKCLGNLDNSLVGNPTSVTATLTQQSGSQSIRTLNMDDLNINEVDRVAFDITWAAIPTRYQWRALDALVAFVIGNTPNQ